MAGSILHSRPRDQVFFRFRCSLSLWLQAWEPPRARWFFLGRVICLRCRRRPRFEHNSAERRPGIGGGMVGHDSEKVFGPARRDELVWVISRSCDDARLTRPVTIIRTMPAQAAAHDYIVDLDFKTADTGGARDLARDRAWFYRGVPPASRRTERSDGGRTRHPVCLMTAPRRWRGNTTSCGCSSAMTILIHRAPTIGSASSWHLGPLGWAGGFSVGCPLVRCFPNDVQAWGQQSCPPHRAGAGLVWHMRHPPECHPRLLVTGVSRRAQPSSRIAPQPGNNVMAHAQLQRFLDRIDAGFDNSLERLVRAVRSSRSSADRGLRRRLQGGRRIIFARDIATLGFAADVGRPRVNACHRRKAMRQRTPACAVLRALRRAAGRSAHLGPVRRSSPRHRARDAERSSSRAARRTTRPTETFVEASALEIRHSARFQSISPS